MTDSSPDTGHEHRLARRITLPLLVLYGLGVTVGAGIYVLIGAISERAGYFAPHAFLFAALLIIPTTYSYAQLVKRFPVSAGAAKYVLEGFRLRWLSLLVGLFVALAGIVSSATITVGSVGYLQEFLTLPDAPLTVIVLGIFAALAIIGIRESVVVAGILTLIEIAGLLLVIGSGVTFDWPAVTHGLTRPFYEFDVTSLGLILGASTLAFYAFIGFEDMVNVAEEVTNPHRTFPIAIGATLVITLFLYFSVSTVAVSLVSHAELGASEAPITLIGHKAGFSYPALLSAIGAISALNGILIQLIMASRVLYGLSRQGALPEFLGQIAPRTRTPIYATLTATVPALALALFFPLAGLAEATSRITFVLFLLANASLILIRFRERHVAGARWSSLKDTLIPAAGGLGAGALLIYSLV